MFGIPDAKRVRRSELDDRSSVSSDDSDEVSRDRLRETLHAKLANSFAWDPIPAPVAASAPPQTPSVHSKTIPTTMSGGVSQPKDLAGGDREESTATDEEQDEPLPEEFEFRLFGGPGLAATKIVLEKDRPYKPGEGTIVSRRPISFYFSRPATGNARARYEASVVTFDQIMERSQQRLWGLERPWKTVATINISSKGKAKGPSNATMVVATDGGEMNKTRKRPGKKKRIKKRKMAEVSKERRAAEEKAKLDKEEHLKAKKKRLNLVKRLRSRAKAKEKKQAARDVAANENTEAEGTALEKEGSPASSNTLD